MHEADIPLVSRMTLSPEYRAALDWNTTEHNPNDPCFGWKGLVLGGGGLTFKIEVIAAPGMYKDMICIYLHTVILFPDITVHGSIVILGI